MSSGGLLFQFLSLLALSSTMMGCTEIYYVFNLSVSVHWQCICCPFSAPDITLIYTACAKKIVVVGAWFWHRLQERVKAWLREIVRAAENQVIRGNCLISHGFSYHCYADDTQLFLSFHPSATQINKKISASLADISSWMARYHLKLNLDKTEILYIPHRTSPLPELSVTVDGTTETASSSARNLGVVLDDQLDFKSWQRHGPAGSFSTTSEGFEHI